MKTIFVCLANSKKYGERCIAGVELKRKEDGKLSILEENGKPKWLRPVSNAEHGEVASDLVGHIKINDIVEIDIIETCAKGYQSENVLFEKSSIKVTGKVNPSIQNLDKLINNQQANIFGNRGKAIHQDQIDQIKHSLTLVKVENAVPYLNVEKNQYRIRFQFNLIDYDLPITDINFLEHCKHVTNSATLESMFSKEVYLCISVGVLLETWYYKLIAGVIYL